MIDLGPSPQHAYTETFCPSCGTPESAGTGQHGMDCVIARVLDCRKVDGRMSSLSYSPRDGGMRAMVAAHEGSKPRVGDYLALDNDGSGSRLYRVDEVNLCLNVDPANMWIALVTFMPGPEARSLDLPEMTT